MQSIVVFGAGKSASGLLQYFNNKNYEQINILVCDGDKENIAAKQKLYPHLVLKALDINEAEKRKAIIQDATVVISLMPPQLHFLIAQDCLQYKKHLITASYLNTEIQAMDEQCKQAGILFLTEMGLDPGIDHLSSMEIIDRLKQDGALITSYQSHCGGLVAPESNTNPWQYKISWNPANVVGAGKAGAQYLQAGEIVKKKYNEVFAQPTIVNINEIGELAWYANRDSLSYINTYGLTGVPTFIRSTLRYPNYLPAWQYAIEQGLTSDEEDKALENISFKTFLETAIHHAPNEKIKNQFIFLASDKNYTGNKFTNAAVLQQILETQLKLAPTDKDMIVMLHEINYTIKNKNYYLQSELVLKGEDAIHTAMAKTVGLPMALAAELLLEKKLVLTGVHIPTHKAIYEQVLPKLAEQGILFKETITMV
jgi:saccharopine dehydrogenase-like NADP-dependent oxidoreductase